MFICTGNTKWGKFFELSQSLIVTIFLFIYFIYIINYIRNKIGYKIHKLDVFTISLSFSQLIIQFFSFIYKDYYILTLLISLLKFTLNTVLCSLLLVIIMWNFDMLYIKALNYVLFFVFILDILAFFFVGNSKLFLHEETCKTKIELGLMFIGFFYDTIIIGCSLWMLSEERLENKLVIIVNEEDFYINHVLASFVRRIKEFYKTYLSVILIFGLSFFTEIAFWMGHTIDNIDIDNIDKEKRCSYYSQLGDKFYFEQYYLCFIGFFIRDIFPNLFIFLCTLIFRWE